MASGDVDPITASDEYKTFRSSIPQKKASGKWEGRGGSECEGVFDSAFSPAAQVVVDRTQQVWVLYDAGPKHVKSPLICLPPVCGTADVFFQQMMQLSAKGYRVISVSNA